MSVSGVLWFMASGASSTSPTPVEGELYGTGNNGDGALGLGDFTDRSSPVQVGAGADWADVSVAFPLSSSANSTGAIKADGTLWTWGNGNSGVLGSGSTADRNSPVQVGALTDWQKISAGSSYMLAVKEDGTLWAWGFGGWGTLGQGDVTTHSSPVQIGADTTWTKVSAGPFHWLALKADGSLWACGQGGFGELGQGNTTTYSSPVQVGALQTWVEIAAGQSVSAGINTSSSLFTWGKNTGGELGQGDTVSLSSPVQVGASVWSRISATNSPNAETPNMFSIRDDGTLWGWGNGTYSALAQGADTLNKSSPVQLGVATNWQSVIAPHRGVMAVNDAMEVWASGANTDGQFGDGTIDNISNLTQVGDADDFVTMSSSLFTTMIIK